MWSISQQHARRWHGHNVSSADFGYSSVQCRTTDKMTSEWTVPAGLRLLLDDIIRSVVDKEAATATRLDSQQIYRLVAADLDARLHERAQIEFGLNTATRQPHSGQISTNASSTKCNK